MDSIGSHAFEDCSKMTSIDLPKNLTSIGVSMFENCSSLETINLPEVLTTIEPNAFSGCSSLSSINLPEKLTSIGSSAFSHCSNMTSVDIPDLVSTIEYATFWYCTSLTSVHLPMNLTSIDDEAFYYCYRIENIDYGATYPVTASSALFDGNVYEKAILNMPNASLMDIKATEPWNMFGHIIAKDGSIGFVSSGDDFEYEGIWYTVIDSEAKTVRTKEGTLGTGENTVDSATPGNTWSGILQIPSVVSDGQNYYTVTEIGSLGFANTDVSSVTFPETLTSIGWHAFNKCEKLTKIELPLSLEKIEYGAFFHCSNLTDFDFPDGLQEIGLSAFSECVSLTKVELPSSLVKLHNSVFINCYGLKTVTLPDSELVYETATFGGCKNIENVFYNAVTPVACTEIDIFSVFVYQDAILNAPNATLASIQATEPWNKFAHIVAKDGSVAPAGAGDDFEYEGIWYTVIDLEAKTCKTKEGVGNGYLADHAQYTPGNVYEGDLVIPSTVKYNTEDYTVVGVGNIGFCNSTGLTSVSLPETVTEIGTFAFCGCSNLQSVSIPGDVETLEWYTFNGCSNLKTVSLPNTLKVIREHAFADCSSLETIDLPESVTDFETYVFYNCTSLVSVKLPESIENLGHYTFAKCKELKSVNIPEKLTKLGQGVFENCKNLSTITLPESLTEIGTIAFGGCSNLESIVIPQAVDSIGASAFEDCVNLKTLKLPESISVISEKAFSGCTNLENIDYRASHPISAEVNIFDDTVYQNATLNTPNATLAEVRATTPWNKFGHIIAGDGSMGFVSSGDDFEYEGIIYTVIDVDAKTCRTKAGEDSNSSGNYILGDVVIPPVAVKDEIEYSVIEIGNFSFTSNQELKSLQLPESLTSIGEEAFKSCVILTSINIPETVSLIGSGAFSGCWKLESISIPEKVTSIEAYTFRNCWELTSISIPSSVTMIKDSAFELCYNLSAIEIPESVVSIGGYAFYDCNALTSITLPSGLKSIGDRVFGSGLDHSSTDIVNYLATSPLASNNELFIDSVYNIATLNMPNAKLNDILATIPWKNFKHIKAKDGSAGFIDSGDEFEYEGIVYTVTDAEAMTCMTKARTEDFSGNTAEGDLVIPETATDGTYSFTVTAIGDHGFASSDRLLSVTVPATVQSFGKDAFAGCERLTSFVWKGNYQLPDSVTEAIGNPNLLVYVDSVRFAPTGLDRNIVAGSHCQNLVLTSGYPFTPVREFIAVSSSMTKEFTQQTPIDGCGGWETIVVPFDVEKVYAHNINRELTPFVLVTDIYEQRPYWLYEADSHGEWKHAFGIMAGVPYLISMPNNPGYSNSYNIEGAVTFSSNSSMLISPSTTAPYVTTWESGREFRSLWLPLDDQQSADAMGLNVGMSDLTDDDGVRLAPGSAFHIDVLPLPLEAYVTRLGSEKALRIRSQESGVIPVAADSDLTVYGGEGSITVRSASDRTVTAYTPEGVAVRTLSLKGGETYMIENLTRGIYIVAGRKITVK